MRRALLIVLGLVISGVFVAIAVKEMDWPKVAETIRRMDPMPWLPLSVLAYLVGQFVRGVRCRLLVSHEANISTMTGSNIVIIGYAVNTVLPARMGEVARAGVMSERTGLPFIQSLTVTFLERVLDGLAILSVLLVTTLMLPVEGLIKNTVYVASIVLGSAAAGITIAVASPEFLTTLISRTVGVIGRRWHDAALRLSMYVANGVSYLRVPRDAVRVGLLSVLVWVIETVMFLLLFPAFGLPIEFWWAALAMAVTNLGILVPSAPGYVGPFHYFCMMALISVGVDESVALGFAVVVHITIHVPIIVWGVGVAVWYGVELGSTVAMAKFVWNEGLDSHQSGAAVIGALTPRRRDLLTTRFLKALVESLVPIEELGLSQDKQDEVLSGTTDFVRGQIGGMSTRLRILFAFGMAGFKFLVRLRYIRGFCQLPLTRRQRVVEMWAYGPIGPARQLFRALRSTALLACYEHPLVIDTNPSISVEERSV